jgi:hypothetical protein
MVWFNVDDGFGFHRKALRAGNAAVGLWTRAGAECGRQLTDGFVSTMLARQMGKPAEIRALVDVELWHAAEHVDKCPECVEHGMLDVVARADEPGFVFHEWWLRNRSREQVERERAEARDRMKRARTKPPRSPERSGDVRANERRTNAEHADEERSQNDNDACGNSVNIDEVRTRTNSGSSGLSAPPPAETPERSAELRRTFGDPNQTKPLPNQEQPPPNASRSAPLAHRIPDDYRPSDGLVAWVRAHCPDVPASEHDRFIDHWRSTPGAKGRKLDWDATWRNWMRRAQDDIRSGRRAPAGRRRSTTDERVAAGLELAARYEAEDGATVHALPLGGTA